MWKNIVIDEKVVDYRCWIELKNALVEVRFAQSKDCCVRINRSSWWYQHGRTQANQRPLYDELQKTLRPNKNAQADLNADDEP